MAQHKTVMFGKALEGEERKEKPAATSLPVLGVNDKAAANWLFKLRVKKSPNL